VKPLLAAAVLVLGCGSKAADPAAGSGSGSAIVAVVAPDAAPSNVAARDVLATIDTAMAKLTISDAGVGLITEKTKPAELAKLYPDVTSDHQEAEDYSFDIYSVGPKARPELTAITSNGGERFFKVTVLGGNFATTEGITIGSTIAQLAEKHPDVVCKFETYGPNPEDFVEALFCTTTKYKHLTFNLDTKGWKQKPGKVEVAKIATRTLQKILWVPKPEK
jgi:hypothetical protein